MKQLTLVSHYGEKDKAFTGWLAALIELLQTQLGADFTPYTLNQIHATVIGLEGTPSPGGVRNENFWRLRGESRRMDFARLLQWLRSGELRPFRVRSGGFARTTDYGFTSRGEHPHERSFSIQHDTAVAIGWPFTEGGSSSSALDGLRRGFQKFGALHKWHREPADADNDFFLVLGHVTGSAPPQRRQAVAETVRHRLANAPPLDLHVGLETFAFVAYDDARLPFESSRVFPASDRELTAERLESIFDELG